MTQCGITPSELETLAMDRTGWRSTCKSAVKEFEVRRIQERPNGICANLVHHPPATSSARSAIGCVAHGLGFLPITSHTRDDETRRIDGSVHDYMIHTNSLILFAKTLQVKMNNVQAYKSHFSRVLCAIITNKS